MSKGITQPQGAWKRLPFTLMVAAMVFFASGCTLPSPDLAVDTARELQSRVSEVRQAAAGDDYVRALSLLEDLEKDVDKAAGDGDMSFARYQGISSALDRVRGELQTLAAAAVAAVATVEADDPVEPPAALPDAGMPAPPAVPAPLPPIIEEEKEEKAGPPGKDNRGKGAPDKEKKKDS